MSTQQGASGNGSTPSLLDAKAASPSAVWQTNTYTTPFRGALAALPIDQAVNAPLLDSSPFDLTVRRVWWGRVFADTHTHTRKLCKIV